MITSEILNISIVNHSRNLIEVVEYTPLCYACEKGHTAIVQLLLSQAGIEVNHNTISI